MDNGGTTKNRDNQEYPQSWFQDGLRFECQRSGRCCRGEPGVVWVNKREIETISSFLGITQDSFTKKYLRSFNERFSLVEYGGGDCVLYENGCKIYDLRPSQCRTFPFWRPNLENRSEWEKVKRTCPGIDNGKLYTRKDIQDNLKIYEKRFG